MINSPIKQLCTALGVAVFACSYTTYAEETMSTQLLDKTQTTYINQPKNIKGDYIVVLKHKDSEQRLFNRTESMVSHIGARIHQRFTNDFNGFVVQASAEQLLQIEQLAEVDYIEPNQWVSFDQIQDTNPTQQDNLWGLDRVSQKTLPLNETYQYDYDGNGVDIYVIDTGVNLDHQEFGHRGRHGWDFVDNDNDATDCNGHGTHVAGIAAGVTFGVAKSANVIAVKVGTCERRGQLDWMISAIDWVIQDHENKMAEQPLDYSPSVINMSITASPSLALDTLVREAIDKGITFVTSAGNNRDDSCDYSPGRVSEVINVAASTRWDTRWGFSNYKSCVDLFAPGNNVKSAWFDSNTAISYETGTSMASPHVAGAVALYLEENRYLSVAEVQQLLKQRATVDILRINSGTPNRLLYTLSGDNNIPTPRPLVDISNGQSINVADVRDGQRFYRLSVEDGAKDLTFNTNGGSGNVDMWVALGAKPDGQNHLCHSNRSDTNESCQLTAQAGDYYVKLEAVTDYQNVKLQASYTRSDDDDDGVFELVNGQAIDITDFTRFEERFYKVNVPAGTEQLTVKTYGLGGDFDLYVHPSSMPSSNAWSCRRTSSRSNETCVFDSPETDTYYIKVRAYNVYNIADIFLKAEY